MYTSLRNQCQQVTPNRKEDATRILRNSQRTKMWFEIKLLNLLNRHQNNYTEGPGSATIKTNPHHNINSNYTEQKKETSHAFLHAFQQKYTLFRYRKECLLWDRYQATRCTNSFSISTNCRRVSQIRLNARNHIENAKCACASSLCFTWSFAEHYHQ